MDVFIEKIIRKKRTMVDYLIVAAVIYIALMVNIVTVVIPVIRVFAIALAFICIYFTVIRTYIEYEYSVTNGDIEIDKIVSKKKRSRLFTANCKDFEVLGRISHSQYNEAKDIEKKVKAITSKDSKNIYFAVLQFEGSRTLLLFEPDERMINAFKTFIPRKILD